MRSSNPLSRRPRRAAATLVGITAGALAVAQVPALDLTQALAS